MNEQNSIEYWTELAVYDLQTAEAMLQTKRYLYVGFMCHLVIEKMLKAVYTKTNTGTPPYSHNLQYLAEKSGLFAELNEEQKDFLDYLQPFNIRARYPADKDIVFKTLNEKICIDLINKTKVLKGWIENRL